METAGRNGRPGRAAYAVGDAEKLEDVYAELGSRIGTRQEVKDVSSLWATGGLALLLGGLGTGLWRRGRALRRVHREGCTGTSQR